MLQENKSSEKKSSKNKDTMSEQSAQHDTYDETGYKKRCYCEKCKRTYDEWCKEKKEEGHQTCQRKCYTICEIVCEKPVTTITHWGYKKEYEGKWERFHDNKPVPKPCKKCKAEKSECKCHKKKSSKKEETVTVSNTY